MNTKPVRFTTIALAAVVLMGVSAFAQDNLPNHFTGAYMGFRAADSPQVTGGFFVCQKLQDHWMGCATTTQAGAVNDTQGSAWVRVATWRGASLFGTAGAGVATGPQSVGGAFSSGGAVTVPISKVFHVPGLVAVFVGQWEHLNVNQAQPVGTVLRAVADQTSFKFGVGKSF